MSIEKYGASPICGYGLHCKYYTDADAHYIEKCFVPNITLVAKSKTVPEKRATISGFPDMMRQIRISTKTVGVFVVFDSEAKTWREYFSGLPLYVPTNALEYSYLPASPVGIPCDIDVMSLPFCRSLSVSDIHEYNATDFADIVSRISDEEIKEMVRKLYELDTQAKEWSNVFDKTVRDIKEERARKESGVPEIESKLEAGFGKYKNFTMTTPITTSNTWEKPVSKNSPTEKDMLLWIKQGRCAYCGGEFKGIFSKSCRVCGKAKDYH